MGKPLRTCPAGRAARASTVHAAVGVDGDAVSPVTRPLNSVARGLPPRLGVRGSEEGTRGVAVARDARLQGIQAVVAQLVVQFVQQFHADDFTVAPLRAE